ncbi:MAG: hypothetical protein ACNA7M_16515 [Roseovarius sp.]
MDPDLAIAIGMVLGVFSIPSILAAFSEERSPRVAAFALVVSGGLVVWAISAKPGGYSFSDLPEVLVRVVARLVN